MRWSFSRYAPLYIFHDFMSDDFKHLHLWLLWELSIAPWRSELVHCYLALSPSLFTLGLHFSHSLAFLLLHSPLWFNWLSFPQGNRDRVRHRQAMLNKLPAVVMVVWWNGRFPCQSTCGTAARTPDVLVLLCHFCHVFLLLPVFVADCRSLVVANSLHTALHASVWGSRSHIEPQDMHVRRYRQSRQDLSSR